LPIGFVFAKSQRNTRLKSVEIVAAELRKGASGADAVGEEDLFTVIIVFVILLVRLMLLFVLVFFFVVAFMAMVVGFSISIAGCYPLGSAAYPL